MFVYLDFPVAKGTATRELRVRHANSTTTDLTSLQRQPPDPPRLMYGKLIEYSTFAIPTRPLDHR